MTSITNPSALPSERSADGIVSLQLIPNPDKPRGGVVVLDAWLIGELIKFFNWLDTQPKPTGFLLMSASSRVFVAGADLAEIDALDDAGLHTYLQRGSDAFGRISKLACPSAAVIGGAALGGGLEIAMHCDALIAVVPPTMDKPYRIGLPEAGLGICPGWGGTLTLPARIDPAIAMKATATGETWKVNEAPAGLLDATASDLDSARSAAITWLSSHSRTQPLRHPRSIGPGSDAARRALTEVTPIIATSEAGRAVASAIETGLSRGFDAGVAAEQGHLVRLRHTPEARAKLDAFLKKS
jgi:enoyl-CoA hydratase/carnithine racemase